MNQSYQSICMLPYTEQRKWCKDGKRWNRIKLTHNFRTDKQKRTNSNMGGLESVERKNRWKNGEGGKKCQPFNQMYHTCRTKVVVHRWTTVNMNSPIVRRGSFFLFAKNAQLQHLFHFFVHFFHPPPFLFLRLLPLAAAAAAVAAAAAAVLVVLVVVALRHHRIVKQAFVQLDVLPDVGQRV